MARIITGYKPTKIKPRKDFDEARFRVATWEQGLNVLWERAMRCPCNIVYDTGTDATVPKSARSARPDADCVECHGEGYLYYGAQQIPAIVAMASTNPFLHQLYGDLSPGSARFSLLPEHLPSRLDRFTLLDSFITFTEQRLRTGNVEDLTYPIVGRPVLVGDALDPTIKIEDVISVQNARRADAAGEIVAGDMVEGVSGDFTVVSGRFVWNLASANIPPVGAVFAVAYYCHPVYVARTFPHAHFHAQTQIKRTTPAVQALPIDVDCWLDWLGDPFAVTA